MLPFLLFPLRALELAFFVCCLLPPVEFDRFFLFAPLCFLLLPEEFVRLVFFLFVPLLLALLAPPLGELFACFLVRDSRFPKILDSDVRSNRDSSRPFIRDIA
jgi:hypothetical protein